MVRAISVKVWTMPNWCPVHFDLDLRKLPRWIAIVSSCNNYLQCLQYPSLPYYLLFLAFDVQSKTSLTIASTVLCISLEIVSEPQNAKGHLKSCSQFIQLPTIIIWEDTQSCITEVTSYCHYVCTSVKLKSECSTCSYFHFTSWHTEIFRRLHKHYSILLGHHL